MAILDFIIAGVLIAFVLYLRKRSQKGIALENQRKVIFRRVLARYIDGFIYGIIFIPVAPLLSQLMSFNEDLYFVLLLVPLVFLIYEIIITKRYGQTLGKWLTQVYIVDNVSNLGISWKQSILRNTYFIAIVAFLNFYIASNPKLFIPIILKKPNQAPMSIEEAKEFLLLMLVFVVFGIIDFLVARFSKERRSLRDFMAGTAVNFKA